MVGGCLWKYAQGFGELWYAIENTTLRQAAAGSGSCPKATLRLIEQLTTSGVVVAFGRAEAYYDQKPATINAGATVGTRLLIAMPLVDRRGPGPIGALLEHPRVTLELITYGVHAPPRSTGSSERPCRRTCLTRHRCDSRKQDIRRALPLGSAGG